MGGGGGLKSILKMLGGMSEINYRFLEKILPPSEVNKAPKFKIAEQEDLKIDLKDLKRFENRQKKNRV